MCRLSKIRVINNEAEREVSDRFRVTLPALRRERDHSRHDLALYFSAEKITPMGTAV